MSCLGPGNRAACLVALLAVAWPPLRAADKADDAEKTLRQQYRDALQEVVKAFGPPERGSDGLRRLEPWRRLFLAELELAAKPADHGGAPTRRLAGDIRERGFVRTCCGVLLVGDPMVKEHRPFAGLVVRRSCPAARVGDPVSAGTTVRLL
jgi:hypothetical protein